MWQAREPTRSYGSSLCPVWRAISPPCRLLAEGEPASGERMKFHLLRYWSSQRCGMQIPMRAAGGGLAMRLLLPQGLAPPVSGARAKCGYGARATLPLHQ